MTNKGSNQLNKENYPFKSELLMYSLTKSQVTSLFSAIHPETMVDLNPRAVASISLEDKNRIRMTFIALDFISLRAILSSYLRWIEAILNSIQVIDDKL